MTKPRFISQMNPVRAWSRKIVRGTQGRPDVGILQLQRKIEILEGLTNVAARATGWVDEFTGLLTPQQFPELDLRRLGSRFDGGYVLPINLLRGASGVVSIGVGDNNDVDVEMAQMGIEVHAWDHTVVGLPTTHELIKLHHTGLGLPCASDSLLPLDAIVNASFGESCGSLILMLDAEGAEWAALSDSSMALLERFSVVSLEFHQLGNLILDPQPRLQVLRRMNEVFVPIAIHPNNHSAVWSLPGLTLTDALEVTYVKRSLVKSDGAIGNCPIGLLSPCCPDLQDSPPSWISP